MKKGFTLIELLVVVLIIGILAAIAVPQYQKAVAKSRLSTVKNLVQSLREAEEAYYLANGHYTENFADLDITKPSNVYCNLWDEKSNGAVACQTYINNVRLMYYYWFDFGVNPNIISCLCYSTNKTDLCNQTCREETGSNSPSCISDSSPRCWWHKTTR